MSTSTPDGAADGDLVPSEPTGPSGPSESSGPSEPSESSGPSDLPPGAGHGGPQRTVTTGLVLGALGVVFGDIGTSPLYALHTVFSVDHGDVEATVGDVYGAISLIFWSVIVVVSVKYVLVVMRADNDGEGGVMALSALARRLMQGSSPRRVAIVAALGVVGASLFYGDSVITPAISVLSAVEGLEVTSPGLSSYILPIAVVILAILFLAQRWGTGQVGRLFGPIMALWFGVLAVSGLAEVVREPGIIRALSPTYGWVFFLDHPGIAFIALGAIVLSITGAEALYADMGHFGRPAISRAWFMVAFPALMINYLGQGGLIIKDPSAISNPFFLLVPDWARLPLVILATAATVIASQAVISGAFSMSRQAMQLGFLPPLTVRQTSEREVGQVYLPAVNAAMFIAVLVLMLAFQSSQRLATAYGISVTGALLIDTMLLLVVARRLFGWKTWQLVVAGVVFGGTEATFLAANVTKILTGGWLPLLIAAVMFTVMTTWQRGRTLITEKRTHEEGPLSDFVEHLRTAGVTRVPGTAVFPHPTKLTTPLALRANVEHNRVLHEHVVIVSAVTQNVPHIPHDEQVSVDHLGDDDDGIVHIMVKYGFADSFDLPAGLREAADSDSTELDFDADRASYFLSRATLAYARGAGMSRWRTMLFITLAHNAADPSAAFGLPSGRTVVMGTRLDL